MKCTTKANIMTNLLNEPVSFMWALPQDILRMFTGPTSLVLQDAPYLPRPPSSNTQRCVDGIQRPHPPPLPASWATTYRTNVSTLSPNSRYMIPGLLDTAAPMAINQLSPPTAAVIIFLVQIYSFPIKLSSWLCATLN